VTHDQTFVQSLVDEGRISDEEARSHPQRSVLLQAVDGRVDVEPVIEVRQPVPGDRYLLCSDGLSGVVSEATIRDILADGTPQEATERLVDLALRAGAPDNVTVVVADVVDDDEPDQVPVMVGAAAEARHRGEAADEPEPGGGDGGPGGGLGGDEQPKGRHVRLMLPVLALLVLVVGAGVVGYRWTQNQYYVGVHNGNVVIYRGVPQAFVGRSLSHVVETTDVSASALPSFAASQAHDTIAVGDLDEAHRVVQVLRVQAAACAGRPAPAGCPPGVTAAPSASPSATVSPSSSPSTATGSPGPSPSASVPVVTGPTP
jgi:protein phosphatase